MKDRIKQFIEYKGITAGELAVTLDVQRSNISHILNGRNKPGAGLIEKLLIEFPELNARWLLTGIGTMVDNDQLEQEIKEPDVKPQLEIFEDTSISQKHVKTSPTETQVPAMNNGDDVEKMILLYKDGTFVSYSQRGKK